MKEYLEGRNLITKLQAKHDLLQKTLGESEYGSTPGGLAVRGSQAQALLPNSRFPAKLHYPVWFCEFIPFLGLSIVEAHIPDDCPANNGKTPCLMKQ